MIPENCKCCLYGDIYNKNDGVCRKNPPITFCVGIHKDSRGKLCSEFQAFYPRVYDSDWCGSFKRK